MKLITCSNLFEYEKRGSLKTLLLMKLTAFLLLAVCLNATASGYSQKLNLSEKNVKLTKVFSEIKKQTGYTIVYTENLFKRAERVTIVANDASLEKVLEDCFRYQPFTYSILNKLIIIKEKDSLSTKELINFNIAPIVAIKISGKVTNDKGEPLSGASITVKESGNTTISKEDGSFSISINEKKATLVVSFIGYASMEISVRGDKSINVQLLPITNNLNDFVVVGYGKQKRGDLTGTVHSLSSEEIVNSKAPNAQEALQGRLPGVDVKRTSGKPGTDFTIEIRGVNSINGSTQPLYIVDDIPVMNNATTAINDINPADIESIDVLKDASSTAIYGSRGANGVVIITTKKGKAGASKITYDAYVGVVNPYHLPPLMNGPEFVAYARDFYNEQAQGSALLNNQPLPTAPVPDNKIFSATELTNIANGTYTNWLDLIKQNGISTNHNLSITGGDEKTIYFVSMGFQNYEGATKVENTKKYTLKVGVDKTYNKTFKFGASLYGTYTDINPGSYEVFREAYRLRPTGSAYNSDGSPRFITYEGESQTTNPLFEFSNELRSQQYIHVKPNIYGEVTLYKGLKFKSSFTPDITFQRVGQYDDQFTKQNAGTKPASGTNGHNDYFNYSLVNLLTYNSEIGKSKFDITLGQESNYFQQDNSYTSVTGLPFKSLWYNVGSVVPITINGNTIQPTTTVSSGYTLQTVNSYFARANYTFNNKYLLTGTFRADGNSLFAPGHQWGYYPSGAIAWKIKEEDFLKDVSFINDLKLRLSAGQVGNAAVSGILYPYVTQSGVSGTQYNFGSTNANGFSLGNLANKDLTWEKTTEYDAGLNVAILKNRVTFELDYYRKTVHGAIVSEQIPSANGFGSVTLNQGAIRNSGVEIILNTTNIRSKDLTWSTSINFSHNHNSIIDLFGNGLNDVGNNRFIGQKVRVVYGNKIIGVWQQNEVDQALKYNAVPGQYKIQDITTSGLNTGKPTAANLNSDGVINSNDRQILGSDIPDWTGGMTNTIKYKYFDFNIVIYTRQGTFEQSRFLGENLDGDQGRARFNAFKRDYWTPTNPSNTWGNQGRGGNGLAEYMNSSYTKISNITLGFTVPKSVLNKIRIKSLRIYADAYNPFIFTKFIGYDVETNGLPSFGQQDFRTRTFMLGVNLTL